MNQSKNIAFEFEDDKIDIDRVSHVIDQVELTDWINNLENGTDTSVGDQVFKFLVVKNKDLV